MQMGSSGWGWGAGRGTEGGKLLLAPALARVQRRRAAEVGLAFSGPLLRLALLLGGLLDPPGSLLPDGGLAREPQLLAEALRGNHRGALLLSEKQRRIFGAIFYGFFKKQN